MNISSAKRLALNLMKIHGLLNDGWSFRFSRGRSQFGACRTKRNSVTGEFVIKEITLSRKLSELNSKDEVKDTILHEIAHAKAGHRAGHGPEWKRIAEELGAKPFAHFSSLEVNMSFKWVGTCSDCGKQFKRHRVNPRTRMIGSRHSFCAGKEHNGHVEWKESK